VLGVWADSDFIGGGTGGKGHRFGFTYQLAKNVQAGLIYFHDTLTRGDGPDLDFRRFHLDLRLKF